ncbi:MAG: 7TM-DISM domain-containing protein, partial [Bacteroidota bacterium]
MKNASLVFALCLSWLNLFSQQAPIIVHSLPDSALDVQSYLSIHIDESKELTLAEVKFLAESGQFVPFKRVQFKGMLERGKFAYWFQFSVDVRESTAQSAILTGFAGNIQLYHFHQGQLQDSLQIGYDLIEKERQNPKFGYHRKYLPIALSAGQHQFFVRK